MTTWKLSERGLITLKLQLLQITGVETPTQSDISTLEEIVSNIKAAPNYVAYDFPVVMMLKGAVTLTREPAHIHLTLGDFYYEP